MDLNTVNEEWFQTQLQADDLDVSEVLATFTALSEAERGAEADEWAQQLFKKYAESGAPDQALLVLEWMAVVRGMTGDLVGTIKSLFAKKRKVLKMIEPAGFGGTISTAECFRRFNYLRSIKAGMLCYNETWGVGVVEHVDYFYQKVEVDFEQKGDHELAFNYAAEALDLLTDDHILSIKHNKPEELARLIKEDPAEIVRATLRSYGAMPVTRLQAKLVPSVLPDDAAWKKFWTNARRELKNDASIEIPKKRSENIVLYASAMEYDAEWFGRILEERDINVLFDRFKEILEKKIDFSIPAAQEALANRLAFIIKGAPASKPEWKAEGFIYARLFNVQPTGLEMAALIRDMIDGDLVVTFESLPSRQLQTLLEILIENDKEAVLATLSGVIPVVSHPVLNEVMSALIANGAEDAVREIMGKAVAKRVASAPMLLWCQRSPKYVEAWDLISVGDLAFRIQESLEVNYAGAMLRAQNQLRDRFQQEQWLHEVMDAMTKQQRRDFLRRINEGQGWDALDRKSVIAKVLRKFPELQDIILARAKSNAPKAPEALFTSNRSYVEKQKQLEKIVTIEIPENSKEIEVARSHGDLRENAEFKYAKERQGLLMAQGAQYAEELESVKPTNFEDVDTSVVGRGVGVELKFENGDVETYYVLGAWDQDEDLGIVSSETRLAQALMGHKAGETVEVPAGKCELKAITELSPAVRTWLEG